MDRGWGRGTGGILMVRACRGGLLIQQKLAASWSYPGSAGLCSSFPGRLPGQSQVDMIMGGQVDLRATEWSPFGFSLSSVHLGYSGSGGLPHVHPGGGA